MQVIDNKRSNTPIANKRGVFDFKEALNKSGDFTTGLMKTPNQNKSFEGKPEGLKPDKSNNKNEIMRGLFTGQTNGISASKK